MALKERELARRTETGLELRDEPLRLRFRVDQLPCADAHLLRVNFACSITALNAPIEQQALIETFLTDHPVVTAEQLVSHFQPAMTAALTKLTPTRPAEEWLAGDTQAVLLEAVRDAAKPLAFAAGVEVLGTY